MIDVKIKIKKYVEKSEIQEKIILNSLKLLN